MNCSVLILSVLLLLCFNIFTCSGEYGLVSDKEYASMPVLFHLDNFDQCMLLEDEALYCTFTFELQPTNQNSFEWNVIQRVILDPRNYRHDLLRYGICVPKFCPNSTEALKKFTVNETIETCYNRKYELLGLKGTVKNLKCDLTENISFYDQYDIIFAVFFISYTLLVIFASIYEGTARYQKKEVYDKLINTTSGKIITAFSIPNNWKRLKSTNENPDAQKLRSIQGLRFFNMICVILSHTIMVALAVPVANPKYAENMTKAALNMYLANGSYAVQTFFLISGWLLSFHFFQMVEGRKNISIKFLIVAFINRYIRLTPTLAIMIAFESTWLVHLGQGPNWDVLVAEEYRNCRKNWWTNLLYINNYVDTGNMCLHQTWYLASDTQLYTLSLLLLMLMWKNQDKITIILGSVITAGLLIQGGIAYFKNYDIIIRQYAEVLYELRGLRLEAWRHLYCSAYSNITGYAIGLTFGYIFYRVRNKIFCITKKHVILWWLLTFGMCNFIILIAAVMYDPEYESSRLASALYWAFGKNIFALGVAIAIFGFTLKIGWFARWICEWKPISVFGRLTYSTYIVHSAVIRIRGGLVREPVFANDYILLMTTIGDIVLSYFVGTFMCMMFEMPISALQKLMVPQMKNDRLKGSSSEKSLKTLDDGLCESTVNNHEQCSKV